jgi:hypothetical protein
MPEEGGEPEHLRMGDFSPWLGVPIRGEKLALSSPRIVLESRGLQS